MTGGPDAPRAPPRQPARKPAAEAPVVLISHSTGLKEETEAGIGEKDEAHRQLNAIGFTVLRKKTPMGIPGMEPTKRGMTFFYSRSFLSPMSRRAVENKPRRATRGMTVLRSN